MAESSKQRKFSENSSSSHAEECLEIVDIDDPRLNFYSDKFDPLLVLRVPILTLPDENAKKYDNLALYSTAIEEQKNPRRKMAKREEINTIEIIRKWLPEQSM